MSAVKLVASLQNELQLDEQPIKLMTKNIGVQIMRLRQTNFLKYIIPDPLYEDQINFNLEIFVAIIRYSSNMFQYTYNFSQQFNNLTFLYFSDEQQDNQTKTVRSFEIIALTDTPMIVPYIASQVETNYIQMKKLTGFFIAFNMGYYINTCKQDNNIKLFIKITMCI